LGLTSCTCANTSSKSRASIAASSTVTPIPSILSTVAIERSPRGGVL